MDPSSLCIGIDGATAQLDIVVRPSGAQWVTPNNEAGLRTLVARLQVLRPTLVVLEATGGRDVPLVAALAEAALPVAVVKARQVRDVARAIAQLAKTDVLDAQLLARFTEVVERSLRAVGACPACPSYPSFQQSCHPRCGQPQSPST
jgi:transposase